MRNDNYGLKVNRFIKEVETKTRYKSENIGSPKAGSEEVASRSPKPEGKASWVYG